MNIIINALELLPDQEESALGEIIEQKYGIKAGKIKIVRRSLDARRKNYIRFVYSVLADVDGQKAGELLLNPEVKKAEEEILPQVPCPSGPRRPSVIIIGAGPAGLSAALRLTEAGVLAQIIERGKPVEKRLADIRNLEQNGLLNTESNVLFGEGGAGAYSDGKLTSRGASPESRWFMERLVEFGAPPSIMYEARPHIGTDRLAEILKNIREHLLSRGAGIHFGERADGILIRSGRAYGVITASGLEFTGDAVIAAAGHSARDFYSLLLNNKIALEKKNFAIGARIEHPAALIRDIQYGRSQYRDILPPAEYFITFKKTSAGRGVYSFCMCPGGAVINSSSENGRLCVNGMSNSGRDGGWSNAAIVASVDSSMMDEGPLGGISLQKKIEENAYRAGSPFTAPAQRAVSFLKNRTDAALPASSYSRGCVPARLDDFLPPAVCADLREALVFFEKKMKGFVSGEALLIGAETRTSSPVRILRNARLESVSLECFYPAGEGSGYSGGIVSSAVDGIRAADAAIRTHTQAS